MHELKSNKEDIFQTLDKYNSKNIPLVIIDNNNFIDIKDQYNFNVHYFKKLKIDKDTYNNYIDKGLINTDRYKLRLEQVSTWISHLQIWKEMIKNNINKLFIIEDRCNFVKDFAKSYLKVLTLSKSLKYDILYIGYSGIEAIDTKLFLIEGGCPRLTSSYIISLDGAKKLVKKLCKIDYPVDELLGRLVFNKEICGYRTSKLLTYQTFQINNKKYLLD